MKADRYGVTDVTGPRRTDQSDLKKLDGPQATFPGLSRCDPWWRALPAIYAQPLAVIDQRTPCRCQRCEVMKANDSITARVRQWAKVATVADLGPPAARQGLTMAAAARTYRRPAAEVRQAYVLGRDERSAPIGRRDAWGVWFADPQALKGALDVSERTSPQVARVPASIPTQRASGRIAALRARIGQREANR